MNKYELALVVSAKIDDDARTAVVDKAKAIIEKAGGTITNVDISIRDSEDEGRFLLLHSV